MLAHELTHVVQQRELISSTPSIMLRGRTARGFFANIFQFWGYSKETLDAFLLTLDRDNKIQGDDDSDDMARQIVTEWKQDKTKYDLKTKVKVLLVREMLDGSVSTADQEAIMDILEGSRSADLKDLFKNLTYEEIYSRFTSLKQRLAFFKTHILDNLERYKTPSPDNTKSIEKGLDDASAPFGIDFTDVSISFRMSPGNLMESFGVNLTVPEGGVQVTVTLTRTSLVVRIRTKHPY